MLKAANFKFLKFVSKIHCDDVYVGMKQMAAEEHVACAQYV